MNLKLITLISMITYVSAFATQLNFNDYGWKEIDIPLKDEDIWINGYRMGLIGGK
jgi:hypothetical protein